MMALCPAPCPQRHPGPSADPDDPLCMWHASERVRERMVRERMRAVDDPIPAPGPALQAAAAVWPEPGAPPLAVKPPLGPVRRLLRLEWTAGRDGYRAEIGDYRLGSGHAFDGVAITWGWSVWVEGHAVVAGGGGFADPGAAQLAAEAALMARLEVYRPMMEVNDGR